jgi:hypothetical protein
MALCFRLWSICRTVNKRQSITGPRQSGKTTLVLEASVRAPQDWHLDAIREAYSSTDEAWSLTAVFCMRFVRGFNEQILEALESSPITSITLKSSSAAASLSGITHGKFCYL